MSFGLLSLVMTVRWISHSEPEPAAQVFEVRGQPIFVVDDYVVESFFGASGSDSSQVRFIGVQLAGHMIDRTNWKEAHYAVFCDDESLRAIADEFISEEIAKGFSSRGAAFYPRAQLFVYEILEGELLQLERSLSKTHVVLQAH